MQKITPFLWFDNNAEEAVNFYLEVFKDSKLGTVTRCGEAGPGPVGSVLVMSFEIHGQQFTALNGGPMYKLNEAVSFVINCEDQAEVDYYWEKLGEGGEYQACGWLKDKFGLSWQVTPTVMYEIFSEGTPEQINRAMAAMMQMVKFDIQALRDAHAGV